MLSVLRRLSVVLTRFMGVIIIAFSALALWQPWIFSWVAPHISAMLGIIMLGMGMTLHWQDFSHVLRHPRDLGLGLVVQFGCMPLLAFALCHVFALPPHLLDKIHPCRPQQMQVGMGKTAAISIEIRLGHALEKMRENPLFGFPVGIKPQQHEQQPRGMKQEPPQKSRQTCHMADESQ